jgi:hypothetical protein
MHFSMESRSYGFVAILAEILDPYRPCLAHLRSSGIIGYLPISPAGGPALPRLDGLVPLGRRARQRGLSGPGRGRLGYLNFLNISLGFVRNRAQNRLGRPNGEAVGPVFSQEITGTGPMTGHQ